MKLPAPVAALIILVVYWLLTMASLRMISGWLKDRRTSRHQLFVRFYAAAAWVLTLLLLWFYEVRPSQHIDHYYFYYTLFNALLITDILIKLPLAAIYLITLFPIRKRLVQVITRMGFILSAGIGVTFIVGIIYGPNSLTVKEQTLSSAKLPPSFDGLRIIHFSDTHLGSFRRTNLLKRFSAEVVRFKPDLICFTGDLVNNYAQETAIYMDELKQFTSSMGNFAVLGNHDYGDYTAWPDSLAKIYNAEALKASIRNAGFRLLNNETAVLVKGNDTVYMVGFGYSGHRTGHSYADKDLVNRILPDSCFSIVLCHDPGYWDSDLKQDKRFSLTLSGHTHALQWGFYPAGISLSPARLIIEKWGGIYRNGGNYINVNRGTGIVGMYFRIDMPAEITLLTLKRMEIH
ncbi:MAG TPA: metallophosphoesterase [Prolixibacteraceae bacterium]|nr:metallophosphoesterase [Prolixibacteraceae bacterium]